MLILFNRCWSVDYGSAMSGSMSVSTLLLQIVMKIWMLVLFRYSLVATMTCFHLSLAPRNEKKKAAITPQNPQSLKNSGWKWKMYLHRGERGQVHIYCDFSKRTGKSNFIKAPSSFSNGAATLQMHKWMLSQGGWLSNEFCLPGFPYTPHGEYVISINIMSYYPEVIMADHRRKRETFPTKGSASSTRAIFFTLSLSW